MQVTASSCAWRWFCPHSASLWNQDLAAILKDVLLAGAHDPTQASALNTLTLNIQQQTASSSSESQCWKATWICCRHSLGIAGWFGGFCALAARLTTRALSALLTGVAVIIPPGQPLCKILIIIIIIIMKCPSGFPFNKWTHRSCCKLSQ